MKEIDVRRKAPNVWVFERWVKRNNLSNRDTIDALRRWKGMMDGSGWNGNHGGDGGDDDHGKCDFNVDFNSDFLICDGGTEAPCGDFTTSFSSLDFFVCETAVE